ncbi:MFS transporter [Kitasatospora phosalacinea]|uniref:MFS transporter n=1 Tax=Kitasatospora phosalacinea TaxID=2065 RepID=UPI0035D74023
MTTDQGPAGRRAWLGLALLLLPTLVLAMDMGVLFFAVPFIATDLHPSGTQQLWIMDMYTFLLAGLLIPMGALGDRIGRRRLLIAGTAAFAAASLVAAWADGANQLIAARALLGAAGAVFGPSTLALIRNMFPDPKQRQGAIGAWSGVMMAGATLGPVLGGVLLNHFWWGSVFLIAIPVMLLVMVAAPFLLPEYRAPQEGRFDLLGAALSIATVLPVVYGIKDLAVDGWNLQPALVLAAGLAVGVALVHRLRTAANPLIDITLFRIRTYTGAITVNTIAMFAMMGFTLFTSQYLQLVKGYSPLSASLWSLLPSIGVGAAVGGFGALAGKVRPAVLLVAGFLASAGGFVAMAFVDPGSSLALPLVAAGVIAAGSVGTVSITGEMVLSAAPAERAGAAGATSETAQELGSSLGIAVLGAAGAAVYRSQMDDSAPEAARDTLGGAVTTAAHLSGDAADQLLTGARNAFADGMHVAAVVGVVVMLGAALAAHLLMRHLPASSAPAPEPEPEQPEQPEAVAA